MKSKKIFINIESSKYNLIVESRDVSKILFVSPFMADLSTTLVSDNNKIMLESNDQKDS